MSIEDNQGSLIITTKSLNQINELTFLYPQFGSWEPKTKKKKKKK